MVINITTFWYSYSPDSHAPDSSSALWSMSLVPNAISPAVPNIQLNAEVPNDCYICPPVRYSGSSDTNKVLPSIFPSNAHSSFWLTISVISSHSEPSLLKTSAISNISVSYHCLWDPLRKQRTKQFNKKQCRSNCLSVRYRHILPFTSCLDDVIWIIINTRPPKTSSLTPSLALHSSHTDPCGSFLTLRAASNIFHSYNTPHILLPASKTFVISQNV